jgi:hypothetical protein
MCEVILWRVSAVLETFEKHWYKQYKVAWDMYFIQVQTFIRNRVSSGSIVSDYGLDDRAIGFRSPAGAKDFSSILCVQTSSGAHPASCPMGPGGPFPGGKSAAGA